MGSSTAEESQSTKWDQIHATQTPWQHFAAIKQLERKQAVVAWSAISLSKCVLTLPPPSMTNVVRWPVDSGQLTARQVVITESIPSRILQRVASGEWSAEEVLLSFIGRATIAHYLTNPLAEVFFHEGLQRARELDEYFRKTGRTIGPLHGLPMSLKDAINVKGVATTLGYITQSLKRATESDEVVSRLTALGVIFYCKTNVAQGLMSGECNNYLYGRTSSPHNILLSAGGSSGGEGSLIALGGSALGIGTDIAGSVRTPANFNGIYGLCPTYGRLPLHSAEFSHAYYQIRPVAGPMCRSIDGLELYTKSLLALKPWEWDFQCENMPWNQAAYDEIPQLASRGELCIGFMAHDGVVTPHPPIQRGMREVRTALQKAGVRIVDVELLDGTENLWDLMMSIFNAGGDSSILKVLGELQEPVTPEMSMPTPADALKADQLLQKGKMLYELKQRHLEKWQRTRAITGTGRPVDLVILPSGGHVAPPHSTMEYFLYEAISNAFDLTCATIPVGKVDPNLDLKPSADTNFVPRSDWDKRNWDSYSPEAYKDGPICLQVLGPRFAEEKVLACLRVIDKALGRDIDHMV